MDEAKSDNILNVSLYVPENERENIPELNSGYSSENNSWQLIVKYHGNIDSLTQYGARITYLYAGYAVVDISEENIDILYNLPQIEYIEKPENMFYEAIEGKAASCFTQIRNEKPPLTGKGIIIGVIDSGVDISHPEFLDEDGNSRILFLWDQTREGNPPEGYKIGTEYTREELDEYIRGTYTLTSLPGYDVSGHGTHVLGIAAGSNIGAAPSSPIIFVKIAIGNGTIYPVTSLLMQAINYVVEKAASLNMPAAINISYGNSYGSHNGNSLLETYINDISGIGKNVIVTGTGNEGASAKHVSARVGDVTELILYRDTSSFGIQIWKNYIDLFEVKITASNGRSIIFPVEYTTREYSLFGLTIYINYGLPTPYSQSQEIYIQFIANRYFDEGEIWKIEMVPKRVGYGMYDMWLPAGESTGGVAFLKPTADTTLTIPSTALKIISVGAYDAFTGQLAYFSGRGNDTGGIIKPDIVAPGVNVMSAAPGGGYTAKTGTSMAAPFVTGAAACLMQWGITDGNDIFMYGERVKANLIRGADRIFPAEEYPSKWAGWGALCIKDSIP